METPLVSVIVPNYNHEQFLEQRLNSVLKQSFQNFELIILDDCSTDNSKHIIEAFRTHKKVTHIEFNTENSGSPFKQWQKGIAIAKGTYIWIAESDDYCKFTFLEKVMNKFKLNPNLALVYSRSNKVDEHNNHSEGFWPDQHSNTRWKSDYTEHGKKEIETALKYRNTIPNASACVFRKSEIKQWHTINEFKYTGDWVFWMQLIQLGDIAFVSETLNHFRCHVNSTRSPKHKKEELVRFVEYVKSIKVANKICKNGNDYRNPKYYWIFKQLKANKISILDLVKQFSILKVLIIPYINYRQRSIWK